MLLNVIGVLSVTVLARVALAQINGTVPPYIKQCHEEDPERVKCFISALNHIRPWLKSGIPEIELPSIEPFKIDQLSLSLATGPNGYKVHLKDLDVFGSSNFTVKKLHLGTATDPFEALVHIPAMKIRAKYSSTGVLIILPASGNGTFSATFDDVQCLFQGKASTLKKDGTEYANIDTLHVDLIVKTARMGVKKIFNNNRILIEATNLFLRENGNEILKAMMPQLRKKLSAVFKNIANTLLSHVPVDIFLVPTRAASN